MRALITRVAGRLDDLALVDLPLPQPAPGEVRVRIEAAGINPADWKVVLRGMPGWQWPKILGLDGVGRIDALGDGVQGLAPGERVWFHQGLTRLGAFADAVCVEAALLSRAPDGAAPELAAAVPTPGFTAWQILEDRLRLDGVRAAAVLGGSGALAAYLIQGLVRRGIAVLATASPGREAVPRALGAVSVLGSGTAPAALAQAAGDLPGGGAGVVVDTVGSAHATAQAYALAGYGAQLVCCNGWNQVLAAAPPRGITLHDVFLGAAVDHGAPAVRARLGALGRLLSDAIAAGEVRIEPPQAITPEELPATLRAMAEGRLIGKRVVRWAVAQGGVA